jgi:hypothetical protein
MLLVERHYTKGNDEIARLCSLSKDLYNRANFLMRQAWFTKQRLPDINILVAETKDLECFNSLHNTKTAKQTIRKVLTDWSNFRKALTAYRICGRKPLLSEGKFGRKANETATKPI